MNQQRETVRASAIARDIDLGDEAKALLRGEQTPDQFLSELETHQLRADGILFLSHWLPKREAVWWACECIWHLHRPVAATKGEEEALRAAVQWVVEPNEKHRHAAQTAAETAGPGTAAVCIANAVFWSGGSISAPNQPVVEAPPQATANLLAKALILATAGSPAQAQHLQRFLQLGYQIARGSNRWDSPTKALVHA